MIDIKEKRMNELKQAIEYFEQGFLEELTSDKRYYVEILIKNAKESMQKNQLEVKQEIIDLVEESQFELDGTLQENYQDENTLEFSTRENGNVGNEEHGEEDFFKAEDLQKVLMKMDSVLEVDIEVVDEWVHLNVTINE